MGGFDQREQVRMERGDLGGASEGVLDLDFESVGLPSEPGLVLNVYTEPAGSPAVDGLKLLASWAATKAAELPPRSRSPATDDDPSRRKTPATRK